MTVSLRQGEYLPIRIVYVNGQGSALFTAQITAPNGTVIADGTIGYSSWVVQSSDPCDGGVAAPRFSNFGSEA